MSKHLRIISVGRIKEKYLADGIAEYAKRLNSFVSLEFTEVPDESIPDNIPQSAAEKITEREAAKILGLLKETDYVVLLDLKGETPTSEAFAAKMKEQELTGRRTVFVIGGSLGVHESLIKRADYRLCLSKMTFTHQIAKFLLVEQIYRACSINAGGKYHR